jgi:hypothetical protein
VLEDVQHTSRGRVAGPITNDRELGKELRHLKVIEDGIAVRVNKPPALKGPVLKRRDQTIQHTLGVRETVYLFAVLSLKDAIHWHGTLP